MRQIRLYFSNVQPDEPGFSLMGGADFGCAIDERNSRLADDIAEALRKAGYTEAMLVLDGDDDAALAQSKARSISNIAKPYADALAALIQHCPAYIEPLRWQQAVEDGRRFVAQWGEQAAVLGWTEGDLFGPHEPPAEPPPSYRRLSRRDCIGLVWLLQGAPVVALTAASATIKSPSGGLRVVRKAGPCSSTGG